ncbi:MAG: Chaperone protein YajL [Verrucomicrobiota bacterium]|jgi:4-methyl-5(b-hydroxyethyl)-thiazole monophosphate biosynthesis
MPSVLIAIAQGFEEIEAVAPIDLFRRAGIEVTVASLGTNRELIGRSGILLKADVRLAEVIHQTFDCVLLPGGPGVKHLRADPRIVPLVQRHAAAGSWVAAICAAPTVLHDAGLLAGRRFTAHPSVASELPAALSVERVVQDGRIITSRGAGTAVDFGLAVVEALQGKARAEEVRRAICA